MEKSRMGYGVKSREDSACAMVFALQIGVGSSTDGTGFLCVRLLLSPAAALSIGA
jgi:hypothetical protein